MKQVILGMAIVAIGICTKRSTADEYYNRGSNIADETSVHHGGGGSLTGVGKRLGASESHLKSNPRRAVNPLTEENEIAYNIKIDQKEIENIVEDFEDFGERYWSKTGKERKVLMKKLGDAYRNTAAKMILNFGKTIPPVVQAWSEVMRHV